MKQPGDTSGAPAAPIDQDLDEDPTSRRAKTILWISMIAGVIASGVAFIYKISEFIFTLGSNDVKGFANVPVTVYFAVASGWLCLLLWCYFTGKLKDIESTKWDMLKQEAEYERHGE